MLFRSDGIIQFREAIGQFAAIDEGFKTIGQERIVPVLFGERRDFQGMTGDDRRLDKVFFDEFFKESVDDLADAIVLAVFNVVFVSHLAGRFDIGNAFKVSTAEFLDGFDHGHAVPRRREVDFLVDIGQFHRAIEHFCQFGDHVFRNVDDVFQVAISLTIRPS